MDFLKAMEVSASGLSAERFRVDLATTNLANAESTRTAEGGPYKRLDPVLAAGSFSSELTAQGGVPATGVEVVGVAQDNSPGRRVYSPGHPDADAHGFVTFPNVNPVHEVVNLMSASRGYEANATAIETLKSMAQRAMDIGK